MIPSLQMNPSTLRAIIFVGSTVHVISYSQFCCAKYNYLLYRFVLTAIRFLLFNQLSN